MNKNDKIWKEIEDKDKQYLKSIESLLKKCPNIQIMILYLKNNRIFKSIVPLITKYWNQLNEFICLFG